jgi:hypothetical protein
MLHATYRLKIAICYSDKTYLLLRDRCYCPFEFNLIFRLTGSKHSHYLSLHPSEHVGSSNGGKRGKWKERIYPRENCSTKDHPSTPALEFLNGERQKEREGGKLPFERV